MEQISEEGGLLIAQALERVRRSVCGAGVSGSVETNINATKKLITFVANLESRIRELEAAQTDESEALTAYHEKLVRSGYYERARA